jgi:hypothetical protein
MTIEHRIGSELRRAVEPLVASDAAWGALEGRLGRDRRRRRRARMLTAAAALALTAAALILPAVVLDGAPQPPPSRTRQSVTIPDIRVGPPETIPLHSQSVDSMAATPEGIWVSALSRDDPPVPLLLRLDPRTGEVLRRVETGSMSIGGLVAGEGAVWGLGGRRSDQLFRIDPRTGAQQHVLSGVGGPIEIADGSVWVTRRGPSEGPFVLRRVDPATGNPAADIPIPAPIWASAAGGRSLWLVALEGLDGSVIRVDTSTNRVVDQISVAESGTLGNVVATAESAWVFIMDGASSVVKVEVGGEEMRAQDVSGEMTSTILGVGHGRVWLLSESGTIDALNAETLESDQSSDVEWDIWPSSAQIDPSATLDSTTGDIWVGNDEGSVTHIPIEQVTSRD